MVWLIKNPKKITSFMPIRTYGSTNLCNSFLVHVHNNFCFCLLELFAKVYSSIFIFAFLPQPYCLLLHFAQFCTFCTLVHFSMAFCVISAQKAEENLVGNIADFFLKYLAFHLKEDLFKLHLKTNFSSSRSGAVYFKLIFVSH